MRQESTGKPDPERTRATDTAEPGQKRGFFAAAGARLKRVMTGRAEPPAAPAPVVAGEDAEADAEVSTSVQSRARELLSQDRAHGTGRMRAHAEASSAPSAPSNGEEPRKTTPPPLPSQRTAAAGDLDSAEQPRTGVTAIPPRRAPRAAAKRPVRDSKSDALRARLGAAKAALAEAQAKRAAEIEAVAAGLTVDANATTALASELGATTPALPLTAADEKNSETESAQGAAEASSSAQNADVTVDPSGTSPASSMQQAADAATSSVAAASVEEVQDLDEKPAPEITIEDADLIDLQLEAADELAESALAEPADGDVPAATSGKVAAAKSSEGAGKARPPALKPSALTQAKAAGGDDAAAEVGVEPIRTRTIARLLARQGYFDRSLSIYDELLRRNPSDRALRIEADKVRTKKRKKAGG